MELFEQFQNKKKLLCSLVGRQQESTKHGQ